MGVLACDRQGCENIMCDYHSDRHGYICYQCREELIDTQGTVTIDTFMQTPKNKYEAGRDRWAWESYVERIFENRND